MFKLTRRKRGSKKSKPGSNIFLYLRWLLRLALLLLAVDIYYLSTIWPDWESYAKGPVKQSNIIREYARQHSRPSLRWSPVPLSSIPSHMQDAVIVGEDARFYSHSGFDLVAFQEAMNANLEKMEMRYGGSTISQQTVKNMFFTNARNPLRKWHELIFTLSMEYKLSKKRILETYLNIAEFGKGIYGVQAAARHYWGINASQLDTQQAAELAASLPSPRKHNPATRTKSFLFRLDKIRHYLLIRQS